MALIFPFYYSFFATGSALRADLLYRYGLLLTCIRNIISYLYFYKVHGMSTSSSSDIVLPMIQSHNGKSYTAGVVRKKSTPKIISTRRHFELYGRGDQRLVSKIPCHIKYWSFIMVQIELVINNTFNLTQKLSFL